MRFVHHVNRPGFDLDEFLYYKRRLQAGPSTYLMPLLLEAVFGGGASQSAFTGNATLYLGVSTAVESNVQTDALIKSGEPTSTGAYARTAVTNNTTNFPNPAAASGTPLTSTSKLAVAFNIPSGATTSSAAWSTTTTALASFFLADASTLGGGNILFHGALTPATDIVNGAGVQFQFAINALQFTLAAS